MKMLRHDHVVRYYGERKVGPFLYIFLEYADGGELFDRIGRERLSHQLFCAGFVGLMKTGLVLRSWTAILLRLRPPKRLLLGGFSLSKMAVWLHEAKTGLMSGQTMC